MAHISEVSVSNSHWDSIDAGLIAVGVFSDKTYTPIGTDIDTKFNGLFTIQGSSRNALKTILADFSSSGEIRGYANYDLKNIKLLNICLNCVLI